MSEDVIATTEERQRLDQFLAQLRERGRSPRTLRAYELDWSRFATWYAEVNQEPYTLERLAAMDVQDDITWSRQQGLKATTLNRRLAWLKHHAAWGKQQSAISTEIRQRIKAVPIQRKQQLAPQSLSPRQARKLLKEVKVRGNPRDEAIISVLSCTGLRVGELVALTLDDVTLSERKGTIQVRADVAKGGRNERCLFPKERGKLCRLILMYGLQKTKGRFSLAAKGHYLLKRWPPLRVSMRPGHDWKV